MSIISADGGAESEAKPNLRSCGQKAAAHPPPAPSAARFRAGRFKKYDIKEGKLH